MINPPTISACWSLPDYSLEITIVFSSHILVHMTFFVNQTSSTRSSTIFSPFLGGSENFSWGGVNEFRHASDCYRHAKITYPASSSHHQTYFRFVVTPPRRLKMPPSRLRNASRTPWRRWKTELKSFIYASPIFPSLFDSCFINCTRFYEHSTYKNHWKALVFTVFQDFSLVTSSVTFTRKWFLECVSYSFQKWIQSSLIHLWKCIKNGQWQ